MYNRGFSLAELSIVLIIIGLLVAGVSSGSKLVRASQLQGYMSDLNEHKIAYEGFQLAYDCIPGDCLVAESFFGASNTNNGDGDRVIEWSDPERYNGWNHLALGGFIA